MATTVRVDFNFSAGPSGTSPPFKTGLWVFSADDDVAGARTTVETWWNAATTFRGYFSSAMGAPVITGRGVVGGIVEETTGTGSAPTGSAPDLPGCALRAIMLGSRPEGGRYPSMFWPCVSGSVTDATGAIGSTERTNSDNALTQLMSDLKDITVGQERFWCAVHRVGGGSTVITEVTSISIAANLSWLQRRYR